MRQDNDLAAKEGRPPVWSMQSMMEAAGFDWDEVVAEMSSIATAEQLCYWAVGPGSEHTMRYVKALVAFHKEQNND